MVESELELELLVMGKPLACSESCAEWASQICAGVAVAFPLSYIRYATRPASPGELGRQEGGHGLGGYSPDTVPAMRWR